MIFYSFYTTWNKKPESLVYRTEDNADGTPSWSELQVNLKLFPEIKGENGAEKDFFKLLWDNEDFRINEYVDTDKNKKKASPQKKESFTLPAEIYSIPEGFTIELNKVYNLDCLTFMRSLPKGYLDYIFTSPPYNIKKQIGSTDLYKVYGDNMTDEEYFEWLCEIIDEGMRCVKKHFFMNIQMLGKNKLAVLGILGKYRHIIKDLIIWKKKIVAPHIQEGVMNSGFEFIIILSNDHPHKKKFYDANWSQGTFSNVIDGINASQNKHSNLNKATFPLYLPRTVIQKFGKKKDIWYDPFNGTGTTGHACEIEDRYYLGTEIDPEQCVVSEDRMNTEAGTLKFDFDTVPDNMEEILESLKPLEKIIQTAKPSQPKPSQGGLF